MRANHPVAIIVLALAIGGAVRADGPAERLDCYGDPLPPGASARLGTLRFRNGQRFMSLAYTPDGRHVVAGTWGGAVVLDAATGKEVRRLGSEQPHPGGPAGLSPDGKLVAVGGGTNGQEPSGAVYE